ncbi:hypothetical protein Tcan_09883 [Toxocara canis]|nr:hypothetical protein Tcan_09883 [Toxocara canis]
MQAAICLLFSAVRSSSDDIIACAEHALFHVLRCDPKMLYGYLGAVERVVDGNSESVVEGDISPLMLAAPPSSGDYLSPVSSPYPSAVCLQSLTSASTYTTPDHHSRASDDSGFNSGFSSPAAFLDIKAPGGGAAAQCSRRQMRRGGATRVLATSRHPFELFDNGVIAMFHPSEEEFLHYF